MIFIPLAALVLTSSAALMVGIILVGVEVPNHERLAYRLLTWGGTYGPAAFIAVACLEAVHSNTAGVIGNLVAAGAFRLIAGIYLRVQARPVVEAADRILDEEDR